MSRLELVAEIDKPDLEDYARHLFKAVIDLQIENGKLRSKIKHLEELLKAVDVPEVK